MGIRFPEGQRPSFAEVQRTSGMEREAAESQTQRSEIARRREVTESEATAPNDAVQRTPSEQRNTIEQAARNAGTQTPGSLIDILA